MVKKDTSGLSGNTRKIDKGMNQKQNGTKKYDAGRRRVIGRSESHKPWCNNLTLKAHFTH